MKITKKNNIFFFIAALAIVLIPLDIFANNGSLASEVEDLFTRTSLTGRIMQIFLAISVLGIAPSILIMVTPFVRLAIVFSMLRSALGLQQSPPNQVILSLALFLTFFIMSPTLEEAYNKGLKPMIDEKITEEVAISNIIAPFKKFMVNNTRTKDLDLFIAIAKEDPKQKLEDLPLKIMIPSFMISELRRGFEIGFLIFLPFLIIDIVVSSILMAMGMMMMPPVMVSLPFKIIFFVIIDGWYLLAGSLVRSFAG
ncbi:MAG UNVERIFIED_CONTAM: flagellar type III secretion system pore protein FliP [Rickettsiaceae bacterium]|jgi:flagellar biosynthetic protein FliP